MTLEHLLASLTPVHVMFIILAVIIIVCLVVLYKQNEDENSSINIMDLVSVDGVLSETKVARFGAWIVSTWGFVYLMVINPDKFPEWYFIGYMSAWVANALISKANDIKTINTNVAENGSSNKNA